MPEGQGPQLRKRRDETKRRELLSKLSNVLAIRFKGIDPDRILNWLAPFTNWFFTKWALMFFGTIALAALLLVGTQFDVFRARLPAFHEFFGPENWFWLGMTLAITKILHEFGHGLSCKKFGGECHEIGVMILVLTPCLYCNVSDSWLLPNKWHRAAIGAAGMYVEAVLASIATFLWWFSEPGVLLNQICLSMMFICSVSTILFNGNPLLRFDGYYILADVMEIPNLRQKSSKILQRFMSEYCLGIEQQEDPFLPQRNRWFFASYTIAAVIYRWVVVFSILLFLNKVLEPYGLKVIGQVIAFTGLFGLIVQPMWQLGKFFHVPGRMHQVKKNRVLATVAIAVALIAAFCFIPLPFSIKCPIEVQPTDARAIYALVPGTLKEVRVQAGDAVESGAVLAVLENEGLRLSVQQLEQQVAQYTGELETLRRLVITQGDSRLAQRIPRLEALRNSAQELLRKEQDDFAKLQMKAPQQGTVIPAPIRRSPPKEEGRLPRWSGSLLDPVNRGAFVNPSENDVLCMIGDPEQFEALLYVEEADKDFIKPGQSVRIKLDAYAGQLLEATIEDSKAISSEPVKYISPSMTVQSGGKIPAQTDPSGRAEPLKPTFQVTVDLPGDPRLYRPGMRGRAKVSVDPRSLGWRFLRLATRTFRFDL